MNCERVKKIVNAIEVSFAHCWTILADLRKGVVPPSFMGFQPTLAISLFRLESLYNEIATERQQLISRKSHYSYEWFRQRQHTLDSYQKILRHTIGIGKSLGDAFVWIYYCNSMDLLNEHLMHSQSKTFPTGKGGEGEVGFIQNVQFMEKRFILHHAITSILRIGDLSLVNLSNKQIDALGEIKSKYYGNGRFTANITFSARKGVDLRSAKSKTINNISKHKYDTNYTSPTWLVNRLNRQLRRMDTVIKKENKTDVQLDALRTGLTKALVNLAKTARIRKPSMALVDPSLVVTFFKKRCRKLFSTLSSGIEGESNFQDIPNYAKKLIISNSKHNSFHVASLLFSQDGMPVFLRGSLPLFWTQIPLEILRHIYFQKWIPIILFNPAYIFQELEQKGFQVESIGSHPFEITAKKKDNNQIWELTGFSYYFSLIRSGLLSSNDLLILIEQIMTETYKQKGNTKKAKIMIDLQFWG